jgi:hypothetical protein
MIRIATLSLLLKLRCQFQHTSLNGPTTVILRSLCITITSSKIFQALKNQYQSVKDQSKYWKETLSYSRTVLKIIMFFFKINLKICYEISKSSQIMRTPTLYVQLKVQQLCILYSSLFLSSTCFRCYCTHPQELQL